MELQRVVHNLWTEQQQNFSNDRESIPYIESWLDPEKNPALILPFVYELYCCIANSQRVDEESISLLLYLINKITEFEYNNFYLLHKLMDRALSISNWAQREKPEYHPPRDERTLQNCTSGHSAAS